MEKITQTFATKLSFFQNRLQSFLENDSHAKHEEHEQLRKNFEASQDPSLIRGISQGLPDDHIDRAIIIFSRLAMFFDSGVLLENNDGKWKAQAFFHHGITELIKNSKAPANSLASQTPAAQQTLQKSLEYAQVVNIPKVSLMTVLKTDSASMLKKLNLLHLDPNNKTSCLLIKVTPDFSFLLFSKLPDLWLKDHTENIRRALTNGFTD
jgi:hypothetical protein